MVQVKVNNSEMPVPTQQLNTVTELVEYVKSSIDPETIIVSLTKNDAPLSDLDWRDPISPQEDITLNFITGLKSDFVSERLSIASEVATSLIEKLEACAQGFKQMRVHSANTEFLGFVSDLDAYISWLNSIYTLQEDMFSSELEQYHELVHELELVCLKLQDQQITSSWWGLGDTLITDLAPLIKNIKTMVVNSRAKFNS